MGAAGSKLPAILAIAVAFVSLSFAAWTKHAWEDYLITFRTSLNLATGNGLVFQAGERLHTFTSPIGTLVPALFAIGGGDGVEYRALWGLRLVSAGLLAVALYLLTGRWLKDGVAASFAALGGLSFALDPKIVDFSMNGMESAFLVFFIIWSWAAFAANARSTTLGVGLAGLQWSRPDGFIFFGALALGWLWLGEPGTARQRFVTLLRVGAIGFALYLPWLLFTSIYYGTPIPHTITAKQSMHPPLEVLGRIALYPVRLLSGQAALSDIFMPAYSFFGGWPRELGWFSRIVAWGAALAWIWPGLKRNGRIASFAFFLGGFYVEYIPRSPWYYPVWETLGFIAWGYLLAASATLVFRRGNRATAIAPAARIAALGFVAMQAGLLLAVAWQMRIQQAVIETNHRREIGFWLRERAAPGDRVYLEPLGYIGYYSGLKMLDFPGLASAEVVATRSAGHHDYASIIRHLRPEWLVLRPDQIDSVNQSDHGLLAIEYEPAKLFDVRKQVTAEPLLPGRGYLYFDAVFVVYSRRPAPPPAHGTD